MWFELSGKFMLTA